MDLQSYANYFMEKYGINPTDNSLWVDYITGVCSGFPPSFKDVFGFFFMCIANKPYDLSAVENVILWDIVAEPIDSAEAESQMQAICKRITEKFLTGIVEKEDCFTLVKLCGRVAATKGLTLKEAVTFEEKTREERRVRAKELLAMQAKPEDYWNGEVGKEIIIPLKYGE